MWFKNDLKLNTEGERESFVFPKLLTQIELCSLSYFHYLMCTRLQWGKMLGGLNPSTDLLVGSTSQYGPVLTEVPSQMMPSKIQGIETSRAIPLSDQEEETHTLMQDANSITGNRAVPVVDDHINADDTAVTRQIVGWVKTKNRFIHDPASFILSCIIDYFETDRGGGLFFPFINDYMISTNQAHKTLSSVL